MAATLISADHTELIARQFRRTGYVGIAGVYSRDLAEATLRDLERVADPYEPSIPGERRATLNHCMPSDIGATATEFLLKLEEVARMLGSSLWPVTRPSTSIIDIVRMEPGTHGVAHRDIVTVVGVVAIVTLIGDSRLLLEDGSEYSLRAGDGVFLDASRRIWHQGIAGTARERVGIVVAKETPLALHRAGA